MTRRLFGILGLSSLSVALTACSTHMEGRVTEEGGTSPISGARVQVGEPVGITDTQGRYAMDVDDGETYDAIISAPGYETRTRRLRVADDTDDLNVDFSLAKVRDDETELTGRHQDLTRRSQELTRRDQAMTRRDLQRDQELASREEKLHESERRDERREERLDRDARDDARSTANQQSDREGTLAASADQRQRSDDRQQRADSQRQRVDGLFQGTLRSVETKKSTKGSWNLADVTVDSGRSMTLAFEQGLEPEKLGLETGARISAVGRYAMDDNQRVLIVERLSVDGATRLAR